MVAADDRLREAAEQLRSGRFDAAESAVKSVLLADPQNLDAGILMVHVLAESGRLADAARWSAEMAEAHPPQRDALAAQSAEFWARAGVADRAIETYRAVLGRSPEFHVARLGLSRVLRGRGFLFQANEETRRVIGQLSLPFNDLVGMIQPTFPGATFAEKPDLDDAQLRERVGQLNLAAALQSRGDVRDAIEALKTIDAKGIGRSEAVAMKAWLFSRTQQWDALRDLIRSADEDSKDFPTYWMALGGLALQQHDPAAITCYVNAIEREPNFPDAYDGLIQALRMHGDAVSDPTRRLQSVQTRRKQVADTRFFVDQIGAGKDRDGRMIQTLGKRLNEMGRPLESLAWQEMAIRSVAPGSPQLQTIADYKKQVLRKYPSGRNESVVRCTLASVDLPPIETLIASFVSDPGKSRQGRPPQTIAKPEQPVFVDVADEVGLAMTYMNAAEQITRGFQLHQSLGTGVACLDYDLDGRVDLYFGQGGYEPPDGLSELSNQLFRQQGAGFREVTAAAAAEDFGYTHGVSCGDWNQDGFPDLLIGNLGRNQLLINQGDGTFLAADFDADPGKESWADGTFTTAIAMADVTGDALPDIVEVNYVDDEKIFSPAVIGGKNGKMLQVGPLYYKAAVDRVFCSAGDGQLVGERLGQGTGLASTGLGVLMTDIDGSGGNEIFVANDQLANHLWTFPAPRQMPGESSSIPAWTESAVAAGLAYATNGKPLACMGIAPADYNGDGALDLHVTNYVDEWSNLYLQNQSGVFQDQAAQYGLDVVTNPNVGFGTQAIDYDNNRSWDLVIANGHTEDFSDLGIAFKMPTQILMRFPDGYVAATVRGDDSYWKTTHLGRSVARCDWNRDGRVDFAITDLLEPVSLFQNECVTANHFLQIELVGVGCERDSIGARVTVRAGDHAMMQMSQTGDGYLSKNESVLFFGLGASTAIDAIEVRWPGGQVQTVGAVDIDSRIMIVQDSPQPWTRWSRP
jgi:tetratricopeptide (TPR) repeat protein